jgi:hypothetical protein
VRFAAGLILAGYVFLVWRWGLLGAAAAAGHAAVLVLSVRR